MKRSAGCSPAFSLARTLACLIAIFSIAGAGCNRPTTTPLRIAAASDLNLALPKLADLFRSQTGIELTITFGSSGQLTEQIKQGAPFDLFLSANQTFVSDLADLGFIRRDSVKSYARGSLVLAVFEREREIVHGLGDLTRPEVKKIALANPATAPYGKAGKQALERAGLWTQLEPKIVVAESVRQALFYAQKGDVEAALIGRALARVPEIRAVEIDAQLYDPIIQALGIVTTSKLAVDAERFARFVTGVEGQSLLREFGFAPPESEPGPESQPPSRESRDSIAPGPDQT